MEYHCIESVAQAIKKFGRYQIQNFTLICVLVCLTNIYSLSYVFTAADLNYRCQIDECELSSAPYSNYELIRHGVPYDEQRNAPALCNRYARLVNYTSAVVARCDDEHYFDRDKIVRCDRFIYETNERTALQEYGLQCEDNKWKLALVGTIHCIGTLVNLFISGYLSDTFGRRTVFIGSSIGAAIGGILQSFSWSYSSFLFFKCLQTLIGAASYSSAMILGVELVQPQHRARMGSILFACSSLGYLLLGITAMYIPYWDTLLLVIFSPSLISLVYYWLIPESTKWLMMKGRMTDVKKTVQQIIKTNRIKISKEIKNAIELNPELVFQEPIVDGGHKPAEKMTEKETNCRIIFNYPAIVIRVAACSYCWITNIFIYYSLSLISVAIGGNKYTDFMAVQFIEIPACIFVMLISGRIGRKKILSASFIIAALALLIYTFIGDVHLARLSIYLIGKFTITVAFSVLYVYTSELMPTCLRQTLLSTCAAFGRIGSIIAPQMPLLELILKNSSMYLFTATGMLAGLVCLQFPETLNTELPDTIEEAIALGKVSPNKNVKI